MKKLFFVLIVVVAFSSFEEQQTKQPAPTTIKKKKVKKKIAIVKPTIANAIVDAPKIMAVSTTNQFLPIAIQQKIDAYKKMNKSEQPTRVVEYEYKGQKVYYVGMHCCDFFNELYDSNGKLMGHPDGGMTGKGDNSLPDFRTTKTNERVIWTAGK